MINFSSSKGPHLAYWAENDKVHRDCRHHLPLRLVVVITFNGTDSIYRCPPGEPSNVRHSRHNFGHVGLGDDYVLDPDHDAGGDPAGLYPNRLVQKTQGAGRDYPAHPQKCHHPGGAPIGLQLPILVGGAVIMENIFNLPELGRFLVNALNERDYLMVSGINLFFATGVALLNLLIDLIFPYLDPRVRYE